MPGGAASGCGRVGGIHVVPTQHLQLLDRGKEFTSRTGAASDADRATRVTLQTSTLFTSQAL